jgi:hypothetical protein
MKSPIAGGGSLKSSVARALKSLCWSGPRTFMRDLSYLSSLLSYLLTRSLALMAIIRDCAAPVRAATSLVRAARTPIVPPAVGAVPPPFTFWQSNSHWWFSCGLSWISARPIAVSPPLADVHKKASSALTSRLASSTFPASSS